MTYSWYLSSALLLGGLPSLAAAHCERVTDTHQLSEAAINAGYSAQGWAGANNAEARGHLGLPGTVTLSGGSSFQKEGSLLASSSASFINSGRAGGYSPNQVLFKCDVSQLGAIYEFFATNGADNYSGKQPVGDLSGAYYTRVKNIALRLTNQKSGQLYQRHWQKRAISPEEVFNDGQHIYVPASAFSDVFIELLRVDNAGYGVEGTARDSYNYEMPSGYVAFQGGGIGQGLSEGADSAVSNDGKSVNWPAGWSLAHQTQFLRYSACDVVDYPATVMLPTMTVAALEEGTTADAPFAVRIECSNSISVSRNAWENPGGGDDGGNVGGSSSMMLGLVVSDANAASKAASLGLTNGSAYTWLLSNDYGNSGVASGVGIRIYNDQLGGNAMDLAPSTTISGSANGWYALDDVATLTTSDGKDIFNASFTASLEKIQGQSITPGSVYAQAQIIVGLP
ncbi:fimbrial usher protein StbD [Shimwellia pseudoproteus]|uniref:fimbrial usher protein StbD n=1 Tax=Shimwellia pseudoproteus TaxID=570012 RepID=UPI0018EE0E99|nr:fimbrial usher protein StbD [Shimwellia pseudoproteus]MBJ3815372.1 fimbrial usher protein StbD [Shimwellia pseudoproteus]